MTAVLFSETGLHTHPLSATNSALTYLLRLLSEQTSSKLAPTNQETSQNVKALLS